MHKALFSPCLSKFKLAQKHNLEPEIICPNHQHSLALTFLALPISLVSTSSLSHSFSVGWLYSACYCSTSDVLVRWLHQDPTNPIPAFPAFQSTPAPAQGLDIFPPHPDSRQFLTVSYWNQEPICTLLCPPSHSLLLSFTSFLGYTLGKPLGFACRHGGDKTKQPSGLSALQTAQSNPNCSNTRVVIYLFFSPAEKKSCTKLGQYPLLGALASILLCI